MSTSNKTTNGPSAGSIPMDKFKKVVFKLIIFISIVALVVTIWRTPGLWAWVTGPSAAERVAQQRQTLAQPSQPQQGIVPISTSGWSAPVVCFDSSKQIDFSILTDEVWWEVRLDQNDERIQHCYPRHRVPGSKLILEHDFNVIQWRVTPGHPMTTGEMSWALSPKGTPNR